MYDSSDWICSGIRASSWLSYARALTYDSVSIMSSAYRSFTYVLCHNYSEHMSEDRENHSDEDQPEDEKNEIFEISPPEEVAGPARMRMRELIDAAQNPDHPRHEEALDTQRQLTEQMKNWLPQIDMSAQIKAITDSIKPLSAVGLFPKSVAPAGPTKNMFPKVTLPEFTSLDRSGMDATLDSIAEARQEEIEREIETLEFMRRVAEGIEVQNQRLDDANKAEVDRHRVSKWLLIWTLVAAGGSFLAAVIMPLLTQSG